MSGISFEVAAEEAGHRLDVVLARRTGLSRSAAAALSVTVDDRPASKSLKLERGQRVEADLPDAAPAEPQPEDIDVPVVYEDDALVVISKPAGLVVHPAPGHPGGTLVNALLARAGRPAGGEAWRPGIVHRLDAGTSGLMIVAKDEHVHATLVGMLASRTVKRTYTALVEGEPESPTATIDAPIGRSPRHRKKMAVVAGGREAITHYQVMERLGEAALLEVRIETGRTHQVRVHLAEIGHAVVGDQVYGRGRKLAARLGLERPFLHAARLELAHPLSGAPLAFEDPLPEDLARALETARTGP
ncbi:MAG TPA: RluA family pseudouridine synthase [Actinomycetota bacterium]|nr:RluA family pseudouridine synthase [Actinomycetota bacterium]